MSKRASISIEDAPIGPYIIRVQATTFDDTSNPERTEYEVNLSDAYTMRLHLDNAIDRLRERIADDAACGDCELCGNLRMVKEDRPGRGEWLEHCPVCYPKLTAMHDKINNPNPTKRTPARKDKKKR